MKIIIDYDSCWRNSFLDGSNNEPMPKKGRKFIGSMTSLKKAENFIEREITLDTVMGVLGRLIGDQRKLYQARSEQFGSYYFKDIDPALRQTQPPVISHDDVVLRRTLTRDMTYIRNMTGSTDQNSFTGIIKAHDVMFSSDYSPEFWAVLGLDFEALCDFIIDEAKVNTTIDMNPLSIMSALEVLNKEKTVPSEGRALDAMKVLNTHFPEASYLNKKDEIIPVMFYCSALYLQLERLSGRFNMETAKTKGGTISGISKRGFTKKDFMNRFTTGEKKRIWGNPYIRKERIKGIGEVVSLMTKASGTLEITLDIERDRAKEIAQMIENAGVSSFYLGKKGLAYVSHIDPREVRK